MPDPIRVAITAVWHDVSAADCDRGNGDCDRNGAVFVVGTAPIAPATPQDWTIMPFASSAAALLDAARAIRAGARESILIVAGNAGDSATAHRTAIMLRSEERARVCSEPVLAWLAGASAADQGEPIARMLAAATKMAELPLAEIGFVELPGSGARDAAGPGAAELVATITQALARSRSDVWIHSGESGTESAIAGIARTAEALRCGEIPAESRPAKWRGSRAASGSPFPQPWIRPSCGLRYGLVVMADQRGLAAFVLMEDRTAPISTIDSRLCNHPAALIPLAAVDIEDFDRQLEGLAAVLEGGEPYDTMARRCQAYFVEGAELPLGAAVVARNQAEAQREIRLLRQALRISQQTGAVDARTPFGSSASLAPLAAVGHVAFVYPGAGSAYPGLGQNLFGTFPGLMRRFENGQPETATWYRKAVAMYPALATELDVKGREALEWQVASDMNANLSAACFYSTIFTILAREVMGITPWAVLGYSLGEMAMLMANGIWREAEQFHLKWVDSNVFRTRINGEMDAVREAWGLDRGSMPRIADVWQTHLVFAPRDAVEAALAEEPRLYLTIINSPSQCVIAGDRGACNRVIARLQCGSTQLPFNFPIHCEAVKSERSALADLHRLPVTPDPAITLFCQHAPMLPQEIDAIAEAIGHTCTSRVDFPAVVESAYAAGTRIFVEIGPRQMCTTLISEALGTRRNLAVSLDSKGTEPALTILRAAAQLIAQRVPMDLEALFGG